MQNDPPETDYAGSNAGASGIAEDEKYTCLETWHGEEEKSQALGLMAGGVAHNINNSLLPIMGYLRLAQAETAADSPLAPFLEHMESASRRLANLSGSLLAYTGKGITRRENIDISAMIGNFTQILAVIVRKPAILRYLLADELPGIEADRLQIRQAVTALVTNAAEAIGNHEGIVTIRTGVMRDNLSPGEPAAGGELPRRELVFLEVSDTGCGISPETKRKIFDPFFSTKFVGRGLGLAAVQGIVRGHGGQIMVESRPGVGSVIRLLFPAMPSRHI